jgi:transposase
MRQQSPTIVGMEACYSSHYWRRELNKLGHDPRIIPAQHQQEISCLQSISERLIKNKTALSNQIRGLLSEFGGVFTCVMQPS